MDPDGSLPCSQEPSNDFCPEGKYLVRTLISYFFKIHFNIIFFHMGLSRPSGAFPSSLHTKTLDVLLSSLRATCSAYLILLYLITLIIPS
jgi:hypothetical protein